ncbi:MAG: FIST C-terminal domain-containing protein [Nitrospirae bacterium]|nr:FIST C-terminal domain-containing protein [Nitrospirota bacterium]
MKIEQNRWTEGKGWEPAPPGKLGRSADLVLLFGSRNILKSGAQVDLIKKAFPKAHLLGCSTAGEIYDTQVTDDSLVMTAIQFEHTRINGTRIKIGEVKDSFQAGERLAQSLDQKGLVHVFVLSDGLKINGSDLVRGLTKNLPPEVSITGGLSGDGEYFLETFVLWDGPAEREAVAILGLYGDRLKIGYGSLGGWDSFGPERLITRSEGNVLYELDGKSALDLYKNYLGEHAKGLPATGLLFPLSLRMQEGETGVVRTILSINEKDKSMVFAGDVPQGAYARLMKANFDRLIDGSIGAAKTSREALGAAPADLAVLISCVGRKLVLKQRIEEEVEGVRDVMGARTVLTGFYSYGEISPFTHNAKCELHNQTMTITTFSER